MAASLPAAGPLERATSSPGESPPLLRGPRDPVSAGGLPALIPPRLHVCVPLPAPYTPAGAILVLRFGAGAPGLSGGGKRATAAPGSQLCPCTAPRCGGPPLPPFVSGDSGSGRYLCRAVPAAILRI
ncbi:hypothetical protein FKM82_020553 [Ascaphus truei]